MTLHDIHCLFPPSADTAHASFNALIQTGLLHLVDLSSIHAAAAESTAATAQPVPQGQGSVESSIDAKSYKRRAVECGTWLRKLDQFAQLRSRYRFLPALPVVGGGSSVTVNPIDAADIIEAANAFWNPIEEETSVNNSFDIANQCALATLKERKLVLETLKDLDLNEELNRIQRIHEQQSQAALLKESQQKQQLQPSPADHRDSIDSSKGGGGNFHGIEWANAFTASKVLTPPTPVDLQDSRNLNPTRRALGFSMRKFVCGTLPTALEDLLRRLVLRLSRGNAIIRFHTVPELVQDPNTREMERKSVFYVVYLGEHMEKRIKHLCKIARANLYDLPLVSELEAAGAEVVRQRSSRDLELQSDSSEEVKEQPPGRVGGSPVSGLNRDELYAATLAYIDRDIQDKTRVSELTARNIHKRLANIFVSPDRCSDGSISSPLVDWIHALQREQILCLMMQQAHFSRELVIVEGWCPTHKLPRLLESVRGAVQGSGTPPAMVEVSPTHPLRAPNDTIAATPPTAFPLTKFTSPFQGIVDTYGVPRYGEVNPGLFTIITFPFLFGLMYGDVGHGLILLFAALFLIVYEKSFEQKQRRNELGEILEMVFGGRYILLMMSLFAVYCGTIYNDVFSIPVALLQSGWTKRTDAPLLDQTSHRPFPYGLDSAWANKADELLFYNSFKMKMAVIVGVSHMVLGLCLSLVNHIHFGDTVSAIFEFVPRIVFMLSLFGYMDFMIVYKWCIDWTATGANPPNLIQTMIAMFLSPGSVNGDEQLYQHQGLVQGILVIAAVTSVPIMLCVKPCWIRHKHKRGEALLALHSGSNFMAPDQLTEIGTAPNGIEVPHANHSSHSNSHLARPSTSVENGDAEHTLPHPPSFPNVQHDANGNSTNHAAHADLQNHPVPSSGSVPSSASVHDINGIELQQIRTDTDGNGLNGHLTSMSASPLPAVPIPAAVHGHEVYSFSDELIHQSIHTIEFVLGTVSNTASYLRLWALSLAHQQLSQVFWSKMLLQYGIANDNPALSIHTHTDIMLHFLPWFGCLLIHVCSLLFFFPVCTTEGSLVMVYGQWRLSLSCYVWMYWNVSYMVSLINTYVAVRNMNYVNA
jgi:vacuolar-type H+-ATPase subunit I/STV1